MSAAVLAFAVCGALNWGYAWSFAMAALGIAAPLLCRDPIRVNFLRSRGVWLLALFGWSYAWFAGGSGGDYLYYFLLPLMAYVAGWCGRERSKQTTELLLAMALGFAAYAGANFAVNLGHTRDELVDFWTGQFRTATGSGFLNTMAVSLLSYSVFLERRKPVRLLLLAATVCCGMYMLMLGTRTQFLIAICVFAISYRLLRRELKARIRWGRIAAALVLGILAYRTDALGLADWVESSNLVRRLAEGSGLIESDSQRLRLFFQGLAALYDRPLGIGKDTYYFHNLWLDIGRVAGIVPVLLMLRWNVHTLRQVLALWRSRQADRGERYAVVCVMLGMGMNFLVEPVLEGMLNFYLAYCAANGIIDARMAGRRENANESVAAKGI